MAIRVLSQPFDTIGNWWLPEAPDRSIPGALHYTSEHTELELQAPFTPMRGAISPADKAPMYPAVYGVSREGDAMTMLRAQRMGGAINIGSGGMREPERLLSTMLLVGAHTEPNCTYPSMSFRVPGLQVWHAKPAIAESLDPSDRTLEFRVRGWNEERMRVERIAAAVCWGISRHSSADPYTSVAVTVAGWVTLRPDEPKLIDWYLEQQIKIVTMLSFLAGAPMSPDCIEASVDESSHRVSIMVALPNVKYCTYTNLNDFFMPRSAMETDLFATKHLAQSVRSSRQA